METEARHILLNLHALNCWFLCFLFYCAWFNERIVAERQVMISIKTHVVCLIVHSVAVIFFFASYTIHEIVS